MTSSGICMECQGEVRLHEEHWTEHGKTWIKFTGKCPNCGRWLTEYPRGELDALDEAWRESIRQEHDDERIKALEEMGPIRFVLTYGISEFPWFAFDAEGIDRAAMNSYHTVDEARHAAYAMLPVGAEFTIMQIDRPISTEKVPEGAKNIRAVMAYTLPRHYHDEDGWYTSLDLSFTSRGEAERFAANHFAYDTWTIEEGAQ